MKEWQLYTEYRDGKPYRYRYGPEWVAMQLAMEGGYATPEEAQNVWRYECERKWWDALYAMAPEVLDGIVRLKIIRANELGDVRMFGMTNNRISVGFYMPWVAVSFEWEPRFEFMLDKENRRAYPVYYEMSSEGIQMFEDEWGEIGQKFTEFCEK